MASGTVRKAVVEVVEAKHRWESKRAELNHAKLDYEYAEKVLILARDRLKLEIDHAGEQYTEVEQHFDHMDYEDEIAGVEYVGLSIGDALKRGALSRQPMAMEDIIERLQLGGFKFSTPFPAREIHGALVKQPWAMKDKDTGNWRRR